MPAMSSVASSVALRERARGEPGKADWRHQPVQRDRRVKRGVQMSVASR
jgi:hypothetical protein